MRGGDQFEANYREASSILEGLNPFFDDIEKAGQWAARTREFRESPRPVRVDEAGRVFELSGERFVMAGLAPENILGGIEDERTGRLRSLEEYIASRKQHGL